MNILGYLKKLVKPFLENFPKVVFLYRCVRDCLTIMGEPIETPMGFRLVGHQDMVKGIFQMEETIIVKKLLANIDIFINVGANIGYYSCLALSYGKYTIAFEPIELNLQYLYKNIRANNWGNNIEVFPIALSNKVGIEKIYGGGTGASLIRGWAGVSEQYSRWILTSTMNNVLGRRFQGKKCLIMVDIEGAENKMLEGASILLNNEPKPIWIIEISSVIHHPAGGLVISEILSIFQLFWERNYDAWTADEKMRRVSQEEIEALVKSSSSTLMAYNFIFIYRERRSEILYEVYSELYT